jgi:peptidoglycan/xylan/chitin deacetylase (PgdA/CDA1 family)
MTAWLIAALERLPPRVRRIVVAVVALVLIGAAITALRIAPSPGTGARSSRPAPRAPARQTARHPSPQRLAPPVPGHELRRARDAAERFLGSYLSFAYGRARAPAVTPVTPALGNQLTREHAQITPVERHRHPSVVSLSVVGMTPGFVLTTAIVADGGIAAYPLRFTLQQGAGRWAVSGVQDG